MVNVLLVEDENLAAKRIKKLLFSLRDNYEISAVVDTTVDLIETLQLNSYDLILSDIQLADGLSFSAYDKFNSLPPIIFCTAFDTYAIKAFKFSGIDYLLKPIVKEELNEALLKYENKSIQHTPVALTNYLTEPKEKKHLSRLLSKLGKQIEILSVDNIKMIYSENKYSFAVTKDDRNLIVDYKLHELEEQLNPDLFFRINRQVIIHVDTIQKLSASSSSRLSIQLPNYEKVNTTVSKTKTPLFREWINR